MSKEDEMLEELKKISNALTPPPPPPSPVIKKGLINEFKTFLSQYKVMGLAVAFILGIYLGELIKSLVDNLIMPIVEFFYTRIRMAKYNDRSFGIGAFIGTLITFLIVAFVIFLLVKVTKRMGIE